jgi:hypothetical protein
MSTLITVVILLVGLYVVERAFFFQVSVISSVSFENEKSIDRLESKFPRFLTASKIIQYAVYLILGTLWINRVEPRFLLGASFIASIAVIFVVDIVYFLHHRRDKE